VQVVERVLKAMLGTGHAPAEPSSEKELIVVAHDLSPADIFLFKQPPVAGFVTDLGGVTPHGDRPRAASTSPRSWACITRAA